MLEAICSEAFYIHANFSYPWVQSRSCEFFFAVLVGMFGPDPAASEHVFLAHGFTIEGSLFKI